MHVGRYMLQGQKRLPNLPKNCFESKNCLTFLYTYLQMHVDHTQKDVAFLAPCRNVDGDIGEICEINTIYWNP